MVYREPEDTRAYSRFSGPMIAHTVFPDGMGELPHIRHRAFTMLSPDGAPVERDDS